MKRQDRGDLFLKVIMTLALTIGFLFVGGLLAAGFIWGVSLIGPSMIGVVLALATVIAFAWVVAGWLLK